LPEPRPTSAPSCILNHRTIWPQYTIVTEDRQTDKQTDRQRSDCIGRTFLQAVVQKLTLYFTVLSRPLVNDESNDVEQCPFWRDFGSFDPENGKQYQWNTEKTHLRRTSVLMVSDLCLNQLWILRYSVEKCDEGEEDEILGESWTAIKWL